MGKAEASIYTSPVREEPTSPTASRSSPRAMPVLGPTVLGPTSRRPGASRANSYPALASLDLLKGYASLDTSHCGNPTPYISDEPSPYIDEAQREQIRLYAFGGDPADPPRPACRAQGTAFPSLGADVR